jgi:hypothetical protein
MPYLDWRSRFPPDLVFVTGLDAGTAVTVRPRIRRWEVHFHIEPAAREQQNLEPGIMGNGDRADNREPEPVAVRVGM